MSPAKGCPGRPRKRRFHLRKPLPAPEIPVQDPEIDVPDLPEYIFLDSSQDVESSTDSDECSSDQDFSSDNNDDDNASSLGYRLIDMMCLQICCRFSFAAYHVMDLLHCAK